MKRERRSLSLVQVLLLLGILSPAAALFAVTFKGAILSGFSSIPSASAAGDTEPCYPYRVISNPATISCQGALGEYCSHRYFKNTRTITHLRYFVDIDGSGDNIDFTVYQCTEDIDCAAPTLSSQGFNGATLYTAISTGQNDTTLSNAVISAGNSVWIHIDKSTETNSVATLSIALCDT